MPLEADRDPDESYRRSESTCYVPRSDESPLSEHRGCPKKLIQRDALFKSLYVMSIVDRPHMQFMCEHASTTDPSLVRHRGTSSCVVTDYAPALSSADLSMPLRCTAHHEMGGMILVRSGVRYNVGIVRKALFLFAHSRGTELIVSAR